MRMGFKHDVLVSELSIMLSKEREMFNLYNGILEKLENARLQKRLMLIRDDEKKHIGYVQILLSLFEQPPKTESFSGNQAARSGREGSFR